MKKVIFFADGHTYWIDNHGVIDDGGNPDVLGFMTQIPSVGSTYGKYFPDFQRNYWLTHGVFKELIPNELKEVRKSVGGGYAPPAEYLFPPLYEKVDSELFFRTYTDLSNKWEFKKTLSAYRGTAFHSMLEEKAANDGYIINPWTHEKFNLFTFPKKFDNESYSENLFDLPEGAHTEVLVFDLQLNVAGQIDELFIKKRGKTKYAWINDSKTNEEITASSPEMAFPPIDHLNASKHNRYGMQISMYAYILQRAGFKIKEIGYTHYKNYDHNSYKNVKVDPFFAEIEKLFEK